MYNSGDKVVYGNSGVYLVEAVGHIDIKGCEDRLYYTMIPIFGSGKSFVPVDSKVFMRNVMTESEAISLIDRIPEIEEKAANERNPKAIKEYYKASMDSHSSEDLLGMIKAIYLKGERCRRANKKLSRVEQQYLTQAEDLLYSEFAVALDIPREKVVGFICDRLDSRAG